MRLIADLLERRADWRRLLEQERQRAQERLRARARLLPDSFRLPDHILDLLPWALATLLIAGVVHIVSILLMPAVAPGDALARLTSYAARRGAARQGVLLLPPIAPESSLLPFEDPAFEDAVCLYDLGKGALRVHADADGEDFLGLSFHANAGRVYHSMTDRSAIRGRIDIVVGDAAQIEALRGADDAEAPPPADIRLTSPTRRGFVLIRSFAKRESDHARARERLHGVTCAYFEPPKE